MFIVTGGAGFIGSNILADLELNGIGPLVCCDWLGTEDKWRNIAKRDLFDIIRPEALFTFLAAYGHRVEAVIHMGAISATTHKDADEIVEKNFRLPLDLWQWCAKQGVAFIYASSAATYGDGSGGFSDRLEVAPLKSLQPLNAYGWSKHAFDQRVYAALDSGEQTPPQWVGLKFFNVYGPNEYHKGDMMSVPCKRYPFIRDGNAFHLFASDRPDIEDGGQRRDFIYVDDCAAVVRWFLDNPGVSGLFNAGTGAAASFAELARATFDAMGMPHKIVYDPMPDELKGRYQYFTQADMTKLREAGYTAPFMTVEEGMARYVENYLSQPDPYR